MMADFDSLQLRRNMVDSQIRTTDVTDLRVLEAFLAVPREAFAPADRKAVAYADTDIEIVAEGATGPRHLMKPSPLARLVQLAEVKATDVVLEIGGAGYAAAILSKLASAVIALDDDPVHSIRAGALLSRTGCDNVVTVIGELAKGYPSEAPYDVVFIGGAADVVPAAVFEQLKEGGRLVVVEGRGNAGIAKVYGKHDGHVAGRKAFNASVRPIPGFLAEAGFVF
ncbi:MAG: protein-L-isoaspartate O-methyltransferase [Rhizobiaceae bacterium]|nr:protein-L-isoaspartate O-methyltransferase [Rhizobiaceae bacterium]